VAFSTSQKKGTIVSGQLLGHINEIYIDLEKIRLYVADTFTFEYNLDKVERQIYLFDLKKDQLLKKFTGYEADVASLLVCHDSQTFISIHQDGEIRKWDIKTEKCIKIFTNPKKIAFTGGVVSVQISEDNKKLIIVGSKGEIYFWDYQTGELLVKNYNLTNGYLWITPPDDFAPNGWLHTNRPELVSLIEMDKADQGNPTYILEDDQRFQEYMQMYNDQEMVMMRLNDFDRYQELLEIRLGNQKRTTEMLLKEHNPIKLLIKATPIQNDKVDGYE
jgi:WD40 repeat protein